MSEHIVYMFLCSIKSFLLSQTQTLGNVRLVTWPSFSEGTHRKSQGKKAGCKGSHKQAESHSLIKFTQSVHAAMHLQDHLTLLDNVFLCWWLLRLQGNEWSINLILRLNPSCSWFLTAPVYSLWIHTTQQQQCTVCSLRCMIFQSSNSSSHCSPSALTTTSLFGQVAVFMS